MEKEIFYLEINPLDKINEITKKFKAFNPKVFSKTDDNYEWLEEDFSKCIVFQNPYGGENVEIVVEDRFTLFFGEHHSHYEGYQYDYEIMLKKIFDLFKNNICIGTILDNNENWYGSSFFNKSEITESPQKNFDFVFKEKEFYNHLIKNGYSIKYIFWNPVNNKTLNNTKA